MGLRLPAKRAGAALCALFVLCAAAYGISARNVVRLVRAGNAENAPVVAMQAGRTVVFFRGGQTAAQDVRETLAQYNRSYYPPVTKTQAENLPPQRAFDSWEELLSSGYLDETNGDRAYNTMLEQYILDAGEEGFTFDSPEFVRALELMKAAKMSDGQTPGDALRLRIGGVASYKEGEGFVACNAYYPLPTLDGQERIPMAYGVLAVNAFTDRAEDALRFLDIAADIVQNGTGEEDIYNYGMPETAACYTDEEHIVVSAGLDPENQARWREMQANLVPITDAGFLTSFNLELFPQYLDGAITAEQCAAQTQERYRMYKLEQGE